VRVDTITDLVAEQDRLESILDGLDDAEWRAPSAAEGWSVTDVVLHLAQSEEAVVESVSGTTYRSRWGLPGDTVDQAMDRRVRAERDEPKVVYARWRAARRAAVDALRAADPQQSLPWAAAPLKPRTLATTRLAEHWAHALDICDPLGIPLPDTDRLRHVAWLGHGSLPYAFLLAGLEPRPVFCDLTGPNGDSWQYGPPDAPSSITGDAGAFCRVGARRLPAARSGLRVEGPDAATALAILRNYAG
jgi:uncharacterized protein (TIGR03084 family)